MRALSTTVLFTLALLSSIARADDALNIAITVDDLPMQGKPLPELGYRDIAAKMITAFKNQNITDVHGFLIGSNAKKTSVAPILKDWRDAGFALGNHTFSHDHLSDLTSAQYIESIQKTDDILKELDEPAHYKFFRYPYLDEGQTFDLHKGVRDFLAQSGYQVAEVSVDFQGYAWNEPYIRCVDKNDQESIQWLKETYIKAALSALDRSILMSKTAFDRQINHVLLIHMNAFESEMANDLITAYKNRNVTFISLSAALSDPAYQVDPAIPTTEGLTFLKQIYRMKNLHISPMSFPPPLEQLKALCN